MTNRWSAILPTLTVLAAIAAPVCGLPALHALVTGNFAAALPLHLLSAGAGCLASALLNSRHRYPTGDAVTALLIPALGGTVCTLLALGSLLPHKGDLAEEYLIHIDPEENRELFTQVAAFSPNPEKLEPLADIIRADAPLTVRRTAIEALAQMESPESTAVLREALRLDSVEVRFFAASVLSRQEDRLEEKLRLLEREAQAHEPGILLEAAQTFFDYAFFNIAEGTRKNQALNNAREKVEAVLAISRLPAAVLLLGRILLRQGEPASALAAFDEYRVLRPHDIQGCLWQAETLCQLRRYRDAGAACRIAMEEGRIPAKLRPAINYWGACREC